MDKVEAKLVLSNYTLGDPPEGNPQFEEALRIAEQDPELMDWWKQAKQSDEDIRERLLRFEPPSDLRTALTASVEGVSKRKAKRRAIFNYLAVAASLILVFTAYFQFVIDRSDDYRGPLVERAFDYSYDGPRLSFFDRDTTKIADWLRAQNFDLPKELPPRFMEQEGIGCRPLRWSDSRVAIICVDAEVVYHLFVARGEDFEEFDATDQIEFEERDPGWTIGKWKSQGHLFVLTAQASRERMESLLAEYSP